MKMSPRFTKAQANMQPGVITADGFLGDDTRDIIDIIAEDEERCAHLGLDLAEVVRTLRYLLEQGRRGLGEPVTVDDTWIVQITEARGHLPSPFEDGIFRKVNAAIELTPRVIRSAQRATLIHRLATPEGRRTSAPQGDGGGERLFVSDLSIHMIETHHFLQGKGSPFRLDPKQLKNVLLL